MLESLMIGDAVLFYDFDLEKKYLKKIQKKSL